MPYRLAVFLLLAGCSSLGANRPDEGGVPAAAKPSPQATSLDYRTLGSCEGTEQPESSVTALKDAASAQKAWDALPRYRDCPLPALGVDFKRDSVYLVGIPLMEMTLDPVIEAIEERADAVVITYRVKERGEISLPATKNHYLALVFKATSKPVRLERLGS